MKAEEITPEGAWTIGIVHHPSLGFCIKEIYNFDGILNFSDPYIDHLSLEGIDYFISCLTNSLKNLEILYVDHEWNWEINSKDLNKEIY